ncbi:MAG: hypothetical protein R2709_08000 [Marmoricola sp.]
MPDFWSSIWDTVWWALTLFVFIAYLLALFSIITDLFRDPQALRGRQGDLVGLLDLPALPDCSGLSGLPRSGHGRAFHWTAARRSAGS